MSALGVRDTDLPVVDDSENNQQLYVLITRESIYRRYEVLVPLPLLAQMATDYKAGTYVSGIYPPSEGEN